MRLRDLHPCECVGHCDGPLFGDTGNFNNVVYTQSASLIKTVEDQLDQGILGNVDFAKSLASRVSTYKTDFDQTNGRIGKTDTCKRIRGTVPGPFTRLESVDETKLT